MNYVVDSVGCWIWQGKTCASGRYGRVKGRKNGKIIMAHRYFYEKYKGQIPGKLFVCHTCDKGLCVNPEHLFLGTHSDNMKDAFQKGRLKTLNVSQAGENNRNAKYTREFIEEIREFYKQNNCSYQKLADHFELASRGHAHAITQRLIWK